MKETSGAGDRAARAAHNQVLFREVNERLSEVASHRRGGGPGFGFVCECANLDCREPIDLTPGEYEAVRIRRRWFAVAPGNGHYFPETERVVGRHDRYWVVEAIGEGVEVAEESDPRSRAS